MRRGPPSALEQDTPSTPRRPDDAAMSRDERLQRGVRYGSPRPAEMSPPAEGEQDREQGPPDRSPDPRPGAARHRHRQERHDVQRGDARVRRRRQGEVRVPHDRDVGPAGRDLRPLPRQGPAGRHRGSHPDADLGRRPRRAPLEDGDRRQPGRDAQRPDEEGLPGRGLRRVARGPGRCPRPCRGRRGGVAAAEEPEVAEVAA